MTGKFGPTFIDENTVEFHLSAPRAKSVTLHLNYEQLAMRPDESGTFFSLKVEATVGMRYGFQLDDGPVYPDPASRYQPEGVHERSELFDLNRERDNRDWRGLPLPDLIIYELHIGSFTERGTFLSAIERLDELVELGITALEIMPVAQAAGNWNWGYDGVNFFAPANAYGRPEDLMSLIDAAHRRGLAVILDVVYNHFGPEGNYLFAFGGYLSSRHKTPWGDAPNFDGQHARATRDFILENVRYWLEDFQFDGLRVDATHFIPDTSTPHIATEIGCTVRTLESRLGRPLHLIGETNVYDPELISPNANGGSDFDGLWCDEFLHSLYSRLIPDEHMTNREYRAGEDLALVLERGYVYRGTLTEPQTRCKVSENSTPVEIEPLVCSIQNHDFIGNHPDGKRLHQTAGQDAQLAAAALLLLCPSTPMLFMGEEFASNAPFYFFVDFQDEHLRQAVERGRKADHPQHDWGNSARATSPEAFYDSKIGSRKNGDSETWRWYRDLIALRKQWRSEGFLKSAQTGTNWNSEIDTALLSFSHAGEERFLIVRLHGPDEPPAPVRIEIDGELLLSRNCTTNSDGTLSANAFAVLAGEGSAELK